MKHKQTATCILMFYLVLSSYKGYLALYQQYAPEPRQIYPLKVETLPPEDQEALENGIIIRNDRRLQELLEDYLS